MEGLGEIAALKKIRKALEKLAHVDAGAMQIQKPLGENRDGNDAACQDGPHEQSTLLDVVDHSLFVLTAFGAHGKPGSPHFRLLGVGVARGARPGVWRS